MSESPRPRSRPRSRPRPRPHTRPRPLFVVGEVLVTLGVLLAGYAFYQVVWTDRDAHARQERADSRLEEAWSAPPNTRRTGPEDVDEPVAFARLWIPRFGGDYHVAVVEGVSQDDLRTGPGHYPRSAGPGEPGNFALAGHRVGRGSPFNDLDSLDTCATLAVETADRWLEYRVLPVDAASPEDARSQAEACLPDAVADRLTTDYAGLAGRSVVTPDRVDVVAPNPIAAAGPGAGSGDGSGDGDGDGPAAAAPAVTTGSSGELALLTLTTCHPRFSAAQRLVVHAALAGSAPKSPDGARPAYLGES